jgi:N-acetylmuramic acid 6-phosphate etherase
MESAAKLRTREFLTVASQFKLGHLVTESFHPLTNSLSQVVHQDLVKALKILQEVDRLALLELKAKSEAIWQMAQAIQDTLKAGNKVFLCGCGATGRLSLVLETLFRQKFGSTDQVIAFMAGGDFALIKSVESFEDKVEYGERQLLELGFGADDLLISPTEGGETPFVIGATNLAARLSSRRPYFLYCNPDDLLEPILRSREVLENENINKLNLTVGPMAISGSTRMQASTVLMLAIGVGLLYEYQSKEAFNSYLSNLLEKLMKTDYARIKDFTKKEAELYQQKKYLNYIADASLAISILTDTTERSPTFSLRGFENSLDNSTDRALSFLFVKGAEDSALAWKTLLGRRPRSLEWSELEGKIAQDKVLGFDISERGLEKRSSAVESIDFKITDDGQNVYFEFDDLAETFRWGNDALFNHLMLKMLLNAHSTTIMGLLGRYQGNVMTWVRPSNFKLIDRAARYIQQLLKENNKHADYSDVVEKIFEESESLQANEPIVLKVLQRY